MRQPKKKLKFAAKEIAKEITENFDPALGSIERDFDVKINQINVYQIRDSDRENNVDILVARGRGESDRVGAALAALLIKDGDIRKALITALQNTIDEDGDIIVKNYPVRSDGGFDMDKIKKIARILKGIDEEGKNEK